MLMILIELDRLIRACDLINIGLASFMRRRSVRIAVQYTDRYRITDYDQKGIPQEARSDSRLFVCAALSTVSVNACRKASPVAIRSLPV
jgi:hypothetical protein